MAGRGKLEMVAMNLQVPRGVDGFWLVILELDKAGPWDIASIDGRCNVESATIRDFVRRLVAGEYAELVEERPTKGYAAGVYRLLKRPISAPRLNRKGEELPEPATATLWRTMKMAKTFTAAELTDMATTEERPIAHETTKRYLGHLRSAGVIAFASRPGGSRPATYRLVRNLGAGAPVILRTHAVFDPNTKQVIGTPEAKEVAP